jgi:hypothetical protein
MPILWPRIRIRIHRIRIRHQQFRMRIRIRIRPNDANPCLSGSGSATLSHTPFLLKIFGRNPYSNRGLTNQEAHGGK